MIKIEKERLTTRCLKRKQRTGKWVITYELVGFPNCAYVILKVESDESVCKTLQKVVDFAKKEEEELNASWLNVQLAYIDGPELWLNDYDLII
jgi:hypothetical protein